MCSFTENKDYVYYCYFPFIATKRYLINIKSIYFFFFNVDTYQLLGTYFLIFFFFYIVSNFSYELY
jgi:hypothetical protein